MLKIERYWETRQEPPDLALLPFSNISNGQAALLNTKMICQGW